MADHARKDETTSRTTTCCQAKNEGSFAIPVCGGDCNRWTEEATVSKTQTNTLSEEQLPILRALSCCEGPDGDEGDASDETRAKKARISQTAGESANEEEEEDLERADPRDIGWRAVEGRGVVCLKSSKGVDDAPGLR